MRAVDVGCGALRRALVVVCALGLLVPAGVGAAADPQAGLDEVRRELHGARGGLERIDDQRSVTLADLADSQARQAAIGVRLQALHAELGQAQAELAAADATLQRTTADLVATEQQLEQTRADLADAEDTFAGRARSSYMYGGAGPSGASTLFGVADITEFHRALSYVQRVMANDRQQVALIGNLERQVQAVAVELAALRERHEAELQVAQAERDRVAGLVDEQQSLHDQAAAEAAHHEALLAELDTDRAEHIALIHSLEVESAELEAQLRRRAEAARRAEEARRAEAARRAAARVARSQPIGTISASGWRRPSDGRLSSGYGIRRHPIYRTNRMHTGVDFGAPFGAPIYAVTDGTVLSAGWRGGYGLAVVIDHGGGLATLYAHASGVSVSPGERVRRGEVVAATGSTGQSTGPHLHFEVRVDGQHRDPMPYLR